jgi:hypothetical protein
MSEPRTSFTVPLKTVSESNAHEHWRRRQKRAKEQRGLIAMVCRSKLDTPLIPCKIRLTRIAPRKFDQGNLPGSFKHVQDGVADWIGIDDRRDDLVKYEYAQTQGKPREYAVMVSIVQQEDPRAIEGVPMVERFGRTVDLCPDDTMTGKVDE